MKIVACIAEKTVSKALETIANAKKQGANLAEIRLDYLDKKELTPKKLTILAKTSSLQLIATLRRKKDGGIYSGSEKNRVKLLFQAVESGFALVDVEVNSPYAKKLSEHAKKRKCKVIASFHDVKKTPSINELYSWLKKAKKLGQYQKIVCLAKTIKDCEKIMQLYGLTSEKNLTAFAMGNLGGFTRILCALNKGLAYCSVNKKVASGQFTVKKFRELVENAN